MGKALVWRRVGVIAVMLTILAGSSVPGNSIPKVFELTPDKFIHCFEYIVFGCFLFRWLRLELVYATSMKINSLTFLLGSLMGAIDECYQRLIPGRSSDVWDWAIDTVGISLAIFVMTYVVKRKEDQKK